jgi:large subunit ribosomal protein L21
LLVGGDGDLQIGNPFVDGARVMAEVLEHGRDRKILVFKYKNKTRYRRRHGHRQGFTRLAIRQILLDGRELAVEEEKQPARPARKRATPSRKPKAVAAEAEATSEVQSIGEAPAAEEPNVGATTAMPKRATRARKAATTKAEGAPEADATGAKKPVRRARAKKTESGE